MYKVRKGCEFMEENKLAIQNELTNEDIKNLIYTIKGKQVMLDSDVARLYHYETKNVNKAVKRNIDRFPEEFCFQLTENEFETLRFQIGTSKQNLKIDDELRGGRRYLPYVFTEQGIAMLAGVLKNDIAVRVSINIIKSFIEMRKFISLKVAKTNKFHDRFIIIDNKEMYHLGASIKDLGKKCFGINKIEDKEIIEKIINL